MENMQVVFAVVVCILQTIVNCSEPMCSKFDYQEQLLEKMIRTEIKVETMEASIKTTQTEVINVLKSLQIDIKTELNKTQQEIKDQLETFSGEMKKHDGEITSFKEESDEKINTAISTMDTSFQQMEGQISRMSADLVELQNETVTRLTETLSGDRKKMEEEMAIFRKESSEKINTAISTMETTSQQMKETISGDRTKFENEITSLRHKSYYKINTAISTMDTSSQQMEGQIGRMSADLVELQNKTITRLTETLSGDRKKMEDGMATFRKSLDKIHTAISTMETTSQQMKGQIGRMSEDLVKLTDQAVTPTIAFNARSVVDKSPATGQTLVFSTNILNKGEGYDKTTGIFTAPVTGLYVFTVHFCTKPGNYIHFNIIVDDQPTTTSTMGDKDYYVCSSADTIAVMTKGMKAWVKCTAGSSSDKLYTDAYRWNTFSGLLVYK